MLTYSLTYNVGCNLGRISGVTVYFVFVGCFVSPPGRAVWGIFIWNIRDVSPPPLLHIGVGWERFIWVFWRKTPPDPTTMLTVFLPLMKLTSPKDMVVGSGSTPTPPSAPLVCGLLFLFLTPSEQGGKPSLGFPLVSLVLFLSRNGRNLGGEKGKTNAHMSIGFGKKFESSSDCFVIGLHRFLDEHPKACWAVYGCSVSECRQRPGGKTTFHRQRCGMRVFFSTVFLPYSLGEALSTAFHRGLL